MKSEKHLYVLSFITREDHLRRAVISLVSSDSRITAYNEFANLSPTTDRLFRSRFDAWLDGLNNPKWYHGWDMSEFGGCYSNCFVFKCKERRKQRRLYGFLCNPKTSEKRYQACILVSHAYKNEHETDVQELANVEEIRNLFAVQKTISEFFKEIENGRSLDRKKH